ncbi:hypothetical protein K2173_001038 [Erythroxylum novogranatense]|uniref:DNA-directed RNA polymerase subunit n=1 Tax=Erythroxylum novogranatense TaxID=1862640 RepID=A0AAV8SIE4_9ROSI|nr:hypothetical protein K2173_001038 [Erythroxylum novogranatense]
MLYLSLIGHKLHLPPYLLNLPLEKPIEKELDNIFIDKSGYSKIGTVVSIYDIRSIDGGFIFPGNGASTYILYIRFVEFRMDVFYPFVGEVIATKLKRVHGYFTDIAIIFLHWVIS